MMVQSVHNTVWCDDPYVCVNTKMKMYESRIYARPTGTWRTMAKGFDGKFNLAKMEISCLNYFVTKYPKFCRIFIVAFFSKRIRLENLWLWTMLFPNMMFIFS